MFRIGLKIKRNVRTWIVFNNFLKEIDQVWFEILDVCSRKTWLGLLKYRTQAHTTTIKTWLGLKFHVILYIYFHPNLLLFFPKFLLYDIQEIYYDELWI